MTAPASTFPYTVTTITDMGHRMKTNIPSAKELVRFLDWNLSNPHVLATKVVRNDIKQADGICLCGEPIPAGQEQCQECRDGFASAELSQGVQ